MAVVRAIFLACLLAGQVAPIGAKEEPEAKAEEKKEEEKPSIAERSSAIGKVVEMLKEMQEQLGEDTEGEKKQYEDWKALTEDAIKKAKVVVTENTDKVKKLTASMEAATATKTAKEQELSRAADAMIKVQAQLKAAQEQRASEKTTYTGNVAELQKGSEAIGLAIEKVNGMFQKKEAALLEESVEAFDPTPPGTGLIQATKSLRTALNAGAGELLDSSQQRLITKLFSVAGEQRRNLRAQAQPEEAPAFVQLSSETAFVQESEEEEDLDFTDDSESQQQTNPEALGGMLNDVKKETDGEKDKAAKAEVKSAEAFADLAEKLEKDVEAKEDAVKELKAVISSSQEEASKAKNEISLAQRTLKVTSAQVSQLNISLTDKKNDFVAKSQSRVKEKEAVDEALTILNPEKKKAAFLQMSSSHAAVKLHAAASFLQMSSSHSAVNLHVGVAPSFLQLGDDFSEEVEVPQTEVTESPPSPALGGLTSLLLQSHSGMGKEDILRKVKEMIREMLEKLEGTQAEDMKKAEWCKREMEHSEKTKADKTSRADKVSSKKMAVDSELASLSSTTGGGKGKLAAMKDELLKATELRQQEKEKASADLVMYEEDRTVLEKALVVLHRVYGKSGSGASDGDGTGHAVSGKGSGVVGLLEMQRDNFKNMEEETEKGEKDSQADFEEMKSTSEITIMNFEKDLAFALRKETKLKEEVTRANADLASYNKEIQAVDEYIAELNQQCAVSGMSPEEKMQKRKQQLASLKEALKELSK